MNTDIHIKRRSTMNEKYWENEVKLRKNITILDDTFSKVGLKVLNVGVEYVDLSEEQYIRFYCEVIASENYIQKDAKYYIKVNVYTEDGELICTGPSIRLIYWI